MITSGTDEKFKQSLPNSGKCFDEVLAEGIAELNLSEVMDPMDMPSSTISIKNANLKQVVWKKVQKEFKAIRKFLLDKVDRLCGLHKANCKVKWRHFFDILGEQDSDEQLEETEGDSPSQDGSQAKRQKIRSRNFVEGFLRSNVVNNVLETSLGSDLGLLNGLKHAARHLVPTPHEIAVNLSSLGITKRQYEGFRSMDGLKGCFPDYDKISQVRVDVKHELTRKLKINCTEDGTHYLDLISTVEELVDLLHLIGKDRLTICINYDGATITFSAGNNKKATDVTITILPFQSDCTDGEWNFWEKLARESSCLLTIAYMPHPDSPEVFKRSFWVPFGPALRELQTYGIQIFDGKAAGGMQKRREGRHPDKVISVLFIMRSDMQGHWYIFDIGGMRDVEKMFCMCCTELLTDHRAGSWFQIVTVTESDNLITFCEKHRIVMHSIQSLNEDCKNPACFKSFHETDYAEFQEMMDTQNQARVMESLIDPSKVIPPGTKFPMLRRVPICRQNIQGMNPLFFIHCSMHMHGRIVNSIICALQERAVQLRKLAFVNDELQSRGVSVQFNDKSGRRQLNGEQCTRFLKNSPMIIDYLYETDSEKRQKWHEVVEEWSFLSSVLMTQHRDKIDLEVAKQIPARIRSWCVKYIDVVGDVKMLQSFYFHSLCVGHIGDQFESIMEECGFPLGLLNMSNVENRHRWQGRPSFAQALTEINAFMSGKRRREDGVHQPIAEDDCTFEAAWSYYAISLLLMNSWHNLEKKGIEYKKILEGGLGGM